MDLKISNFQRSPRRSGDLLSFENPRQRIIRSYTKFSRMRNFLTRDQRVIIGDERTKNKNLNKFGNVGKLKIRNHITTSTTFTFGNRREFSKIQKFREARSLRKKTKSVTGVMQFYKHESEISCQWQKCSAQCSSTKYQNISQH